MVMDNELVSVSDDSLNNAIVQYEERMLQALSWYGLPADNIFVGVDERKKVYKNANDVIMLLTEEQRSYASYVSKFLVAAGAGLFDSALNYLWNETIVQLRKRVAQYDIQYFYDLAVTSDKRSRLQTVDDLYKLDDSELIKGAREIDLISDIGYKHLDYIKYMRNWASAAHPNQTELTGLQLISWLETCIKEVICLPETNVTIQISRLLKNIKTNIISQEEAETIGTFFYELLEEKSNSLASGFFGIYTRKDTTEQTRKNIRLLLPLLWNCINENVKYDFGTRYAQFAACNDQDEAKEARSFLQIVNAEQYIPEIIRGAEVKTAVDNLTSAHNGLNNFYLEPSFARQLKRLVGDGELPKGLDIYYSRAVVNVYITNGNGPCWDAESIYLSMINNFNQRQACAAIIAFTEDRIASKLQFQLCRDKYLNMLEILKLKLTSPPLLEMISAIEGFGGNLSRLRDDHAIKSKLEALKFLIR